MQQKIVQNLGQWFGWIGSAGISFQPQAVSNGGLRINDAAGGKLTRNQMRLHNKWCSRFASQRLLKCIIQPVERLTGIIDFVKMTFALRRRSKQRIGLGVWTCHFFMIVVDTWNTPTVELNQKEFYSVLSEELIDNSYGSRGCPSSQPQSSPTNAASFVQDACIRALESGGPHAGLLTHLTPVKQLKSNKGERTSFRYQGRCKECQKKTTWQCSDCGDGGKTVYLCATKNGQRCFLDHLARNHMHLSELWA